MKANKPGQYIHSKIVSVPNDNKGDILILLSTDNFSKFSFEATISKQINLDSIEYHIHKTVSDIHRSHPHIKPVIFLSYGAEFMTELNSKFEHTCSIEYNPAIADEIALPEAHALVNQITYNPGRNL